MHNETFSSSKSKFRKTEMFFYKKEFFHITWSKTKFLGVKRSNFQNCFLTFILKFKRHRWDRCNLNSFLSRKQFYSTGRKFQLPTHFPFHAIDSGTPMFEDILSNSFIFTSSHVIANTEYYGGVSSFLFVGLTRNTIQHCSA